MKRRWLAVLAMALFAGCDTEPAAAPATDTAAVFLKQEQERFSPGNYAASARAAPALMAVDATTEVHAISDLTRPVIPSNMVVRTATASIEVDSLQPAVTALRQLAERLGGYVGGTGIETGKNRIRKAFIEVKIPAARFDEVLSGLSPIGKLESVNVNAEDVGEEYVDVNARMDNARRLERRLIELLATRTGKLKDVLDVEQSLARVREEIERYEGRLRYLRAHTAMSTLNVTVHEPIPVVGGAGRSVMGESFRQAWRNFVLLVAWTVQAMGVVLPLALVALIGWIGTKRWRLRGA